MLKEQKTIITGIDVGTTKIAVIIAECENENITIITTVESLGELSYLYEFGDGTNVTNNQIKNVTHSYSPWRTDPPYLLVVTASNPFASSNITMDIPVQMFVHNLTGFEISVPNANITRTEAIHLTIVTGDYFICFWNFGDESPIITVTYEEYLNANRTVYHHYTKEGTYDVTLKCNNRLYYATASAILHSYIPVTDFQVIYFLGQ